MFDQKVDLSYTVLRADSGENQSEGILERIKEPPWARCLQGAVDARWVVVRCVVVAFPGGH